MQCRRHARAEPGCPCCGTVKRYPPGWIRALHMVAAAIGGVAIVIVCAVLVYSMLAFEFD